MQQDHLALALPGQLDGDVQGPVRVLDEVSKALPELVWLEDLTLTGNALRLRGYRALTAP